jgi:hypothetical protein
VATKKSQTLAKYAPLTQNEQVMLQNLRRSTAIGDFVAICRTDYVQPYWDLWVTGYNYYWTEWLFLVKNLLQSPDDLSTLVYLPEDLGEVYLVDVPAQAPTLQHLTQKGIRDYELSSGYEAAVNRELLKDYGVEPSRSIFHSVDPQTGDWWTVLDQGLSVKYNNFEVEFNGVSYKYSFPKDVEAATAMSMSYATRRGAYPMEESLKANQKFDIVPAIPDGKTANIWVREFYADPSQNAPFEIMSFQCTQMPPESITPGEPSVHFNLSFGNRISLDASVADYLARKYVQLGLRSPSVRFKSVY